MRKIVTRIRVKSICASIKLKLVFSFFLFKKDSIRFECFYAQDEVFAEFS